MSHWHRLRRFELSERDYPGASCFVPAWHYATPPARVIQMVVIHITGGPATDENPAVNRFLGPSGERHADTPLARRTGASAHYIVNREGSIVQMVRDAHVANHARNITHPASAMSIGIEHVNRWNHLAHDHPTDVQYRASAQLVRWLCDRYGIPKAHVPEPALMPGIKGHSEVDPRSHHVHCPNPAWDWDLYMGLVNSAENFDISRPTAI